MNPKHQREPGTILITGANRGIGLELSRQYLEAGWRVFACCRSPENALELNRIRTQAGGRLSVHLLDVTNPAQRRALKDELADRPLDVLVNNAGTHGEAASRLEALDETSWLETLRINAIAPLKLIEALRENVAASHRRILATLTSKMGSMGDNGSGGSYAYRSSKAALNAALKSAAIDLQPYGITVLILHPGWVRTDMGGPDGELSPTESAERLRRIIDHARPEDSGRFIDIDGGTIPW